jgi:hypothetical protein
MSWLALLPRARKYGLIGRLGVAVAIEDTENWIEHTLIIDPDTAQLLAEEQVALMDHPRASPR